MVWMAQNAHWLDVFLYLGAYAKAFGCDVSEAEIDDIAQYSNLGEFFRRKLKVGVCSFRLSILVNLSWTNKVYASLLCHQDIKSND